tara:strand:- start:1801 stop:2709 length:909 start_codon:yes stop_codon:yes gene_type:complete
MIRNDDCNVGSLTIESLEGTTQNGNCGALLVKGGICCNENIKIENALYSKCISTNEIKANIDHIKINGDLIPNSLDLNLGSENLIWNSINVKNINSKFSIHSNQLHVNTLNVLTSAQIGSASESMENGQFNSILEINSRDICQNTSVVLRPDNTYLVDSKNKCYGDLNSNGIIFDTNLLVGDPDLPTISVEPNENRVLMCGELILLGQGMIKSFKKINVNENMKLDLKQQYNLLKINSKCNIDLELNDQVKEKKILPGITRNIIIYQNNNDSKVYIKELDIKINRGIEILYDGYKWILTNSF